MALDKRTEIPFLPPYEHEDRVEWEELVIAITTIYTEQTEAPVTVSLS